MLDLDDFLHRLRHRFWPFWPLVALIILASLLIGYTYLQIRPTEYDVSMVVSPVTPPGRTENTSIVAGAAASLLGLTSGGSGAANSDRYQELIVSTALADRIDRTGPIYKTLYSAEWDSENNRWRPPTGILSTVKRLVSSVLGGQPWRAPDAARLASDLKRSLIFTPVGRSDLFRVTLRTENPKFAIFLLSTLNGMTDTMIREIERKRVNAYLTYLDSELPVVQNTENRTAISQLVMDEQRALMQLSANGVSYATQLMEPPTIPYQPVGLRALSVMAITGLLGLIAGLVSIALLPERWIRENTLPAWLVRARA